MKLKKLMALAAAGVLASATMASAHVWNIGWKSTGGNLTFYGVSYHGALNASRDNFAANPAGFVVNGTNLNFDIGSVVDLTSDCIGAGGLTSGTCDAQFNALGLDGALASTPFPSDTYGKYATATILAADLGTYMLGSGANSVTLTTFANNVDWDGVAFSSASVPLNIVISAVPLPAGLPMALAGFGLLGGLGLRKRAKKAA
ncbi:hypothetical protein N9M66_04660 [Litoreibacter sp.]|nr:hypothetical protein [Litoreibacter sp.]